MPTNIELLKRVIEGTDKSAADELWEDGDTMFWVDWREQDDDIPRYCEGLLQTGSLSTSVYNTEEEPGFAFDIYYKGATTRVPIVVGPEDRHITLVTLNWVLYPDYELRYFIPTSSTDGAGIVPLPMRVWKELEAEFGQKVAKQFYRLAEGPNIFTDPIEFDENGSPESISESESEPEIEAPRTVSPFPPAGFTATPSQPASFHYTSQYTAQPVADRGPARPLTIIELLFSLNGRISRGTWWFSVALQIGIGVAFAVLAGVLHGVAGKAWDTMINAATGVLIVLLCYIHIASAVKRFHDIDITGWAVTMLAIPFIGELTWLIVLGCLPGKNLGINGANNQYGPDPLQTPPGPIFVRSARWGV